MTAQPNAGWADRLGSTARAALIVVTSILAVFVIGMVAGFTHAIFEDGRLPTKPLAYLTFAAIIGAAALVGWVLATLIRSLRPHSMSGFDRRYWKMCAIIFGLSVPIGIVLAIFGLSDQDDGFSLILSDAPITPLIAIATSILVTILLALAAIYYHRTVDDHEERAYLWGSTIAFYILVLAFPLYWLLARGGLVPQITIGIAMLIILLSCIVQAIVWALFKFR